MEEKKPEEAAKFKQMTGKDVKKEKNKPETKKEKGNKVGFAVGGIVVLIVLIIVSALLILPNTPEKTIDGMLNCLKNGDFEGVNKYVNYEEIAKDASTFEDVKDDKELASLMFDKLSWKVNKVTKEKDKATVEVEITNKDFKKVITNYTQEALKIAFSGQTFSDEEQNNTLKEELKDESVGTKTVTATLNLNKENGKWKVQTEDTLISALLPGLEEAINSLNSIINE